MTDFKKNYLIKSDLSDLSESDTIQKLVKSSKYIDTSIVNGLRRYIISRINTLAFDYSHVPMETEYITFKKNTSEMNNDFIGHRIGLLPIKIVYIKYLLFIYKIIIGHHNELNELLDENDETIIHNKLKTLLKLSNQNNIVDEAIKIKEGESNRSRITHYLIIYSMMKQSLLPSNFTNNKDTLDGIKDFIENFDIQQMRSEIKALRADIEALKK